ncbi:BOW99_gp33 family protein [Marinilactibacillus psychrotolerans]|uniref:BOW99_gp33 family protein n=1 Tax=Marinilactibacillus psychrotolerans TaxID=191770 RepID=UPI003884DFA2
MKVINVMKDGTERESMKGVVIPLDISKVIVEIMIRDQKEKRKEQKEKESRTQ